LRQRLERQGKKRVGLVAGADFSTKKKIGNLEVGLLTVLAKL